MSIQAILLRVFTFNFGNDWEHHKGIESIGHHIKHHHAHMTMYYECVQGYYALKGAAATRQAQEAHKHMEWAKLHLAKVLELRKVYGPAQITDEMIEKCPALRCPAARHLT